MKIFQLKESDQMIMKIGHCMTQVFLGANGKDIYRDCDSYDRKSNPLLPKTTLNKVRVLIAPEVRAYVYVVAEDQKGRLNPWTRNGSLDFSSPERIRLIVSNHKKKTEQEIVIRWLWENGIQYSELFRGPEKSTNREKQALTSTVKIPEEVLETIKSNENGKGKTDKDYYRDGDDTRKKKNPKTRDKEKKINVLGLSGKDAGEALA